MKINKIHFLLFIVITAFCLAIYLSIFNPIINMYPAYYDLALEIQNHNFSSKFRAFGYSALISIMDNVEINIRIFQFLSLIFVWIISLYVCLDINTISKIKNLKVVSFSFIYFFFWFIYLFFNPYLHLNITRIIDTSLATFFITIIYALITLKFNFSKTLLIVGGISLGILITIRPNSIILLIFFLFFFNKNFISKYQTLIIFVSTLLTYVIFSKFFTGEIFYWPNNGPYNLFSGNNPYTFEFTVLDYNSELSLEKANKWCGIEFNDTHLVSSAEYFNCTLKYIQMIFLVFLKLQFFKTYNLLFRPNLRLAFETYKVIFQILLIIPAYLWWLSFFLNSNFRK